jgi:hypothetical protein
VCYFVPSGDLPMSLDLLARLDYLEIAEAIREGSWMEAGHGRKECQKDFIFGREWNQQFYATKRVRAIFVENPQEILVVTVYVYYF